MPKYGGKRSWTINCIGVDIVFCWIETSEGFSISLLGAESSDSCLLDAISQLFANVKGKGDDQSGDTGRGNWSTERVHGKAACHKWNTAKVGCNRVNCAFGHGCPIKLPNGEPCGQQHKAYRPNLLTGVNRRTRLVQFLVHVCGIRIDRSRASRTAPEVHPQRTVSTRGPIWTHSVHPRRRVSTWKVCKMTRLLLYQRTWCCPFQKGPSLDRELRGNTWMCYLLGRKDNCYL